MLELSYDAHLVYFLCAWYFLIFSYKTYYLLKKMFFELKCIMCVAHDCIFCQFKQRKANKRISLGFSQSFSFKKTKKNWGRPKLEEQEVNLILTQSSRGSIAFDPFFIYLHWFSFYWCNLFLFFPAFSVYVCFDLNLLDVLDGGGSGHSMKIHLPGWLFFFYDNKNCIT